MKLARRSFLFGAGASLLAAPAIARAASLMPMRAIEPLYGAGPAMMAVNDAFLGDLFKMLVNFPDMTATEIIDLVNEKTLLLGA